MQTRLSKEERNELKSRYRENPLYKVIAASCKQFEKELQTLRLTPEEVFQETLAQIDNVLSAGSGSDARQLCVSMYDDLYCDMRDVAPDGTDDEELVKATCIVMITALYCFVMFDDERIKSYGFSLACAMGSRYPQWTAVQQKFLSRAVQCGIGELKTWLDEYSRREMLLTDEDGLLTLCDDEETETQAMTIAMQNVGLEEDDNKAGMKVRALMLYEILKEGGFVRDKDTTVVAELISFIIGSSYKSLYNLMTQYGGIELSEKQHRKHVMAANKILGKIGSDIELKLKKS